MGSGHSFRVQRRILQDEKAWIQTRTIRALQQGKSSRLQSILEDEGVQLAVKEYTAQAGDKISAEEMRKAVEKYLEDPENSFHQEDGLILSKTFLEMEQIETTNAQRRDDACRERDKHSGDHDLEDQRFIGHHVRYRKVKPGLCVRTMQRWLHWMGYKWKEVRKGIYKDGHERKDVVSYRQEEFLPFMANVEPRLAKWNAELEPLPPTVDPRVASLWKAFAEYPLELQLNIMRFLRNDPAAVPCELVPIIHDECTYNANDGDHHQWILGDHNPLSKKIPRCGFNGLRVSHAERSIVTALGMHAGGNG
jgi:hypothetical protein